jgi:UDP-N-acetylglucosamine 2-epimerase
VKIVSVVGARPQFIKAATVSRHLRRAHQEVLVHTSQHYDAQLSDVFFAQLDLPAPDHHLGVGSAPHGRQTAQMLERLEDVLLQEKPDRVLVYGDTNSTLAGALAAVKLHIPLAHVEAGLRSYDRRMPEEINRVLTDHCADLLFCPTATAVENLAREGITASVHLVGDVMYDSLLQQLPDERAAQEALSQQGLSPREYLLVTVHRAANTDDPARLGAILQALAELSLPVVFPIHPRTRKAIAAAGLSLAPSIHLREPLGYRDMLVLERHARTILTDSGGVQKEAFFLGVPCVTLREETEWPETVECGWNVLAGADPERIVAAAKRPALKGERPPLFGDGHAAEKIVRSLER